MRALVLSNEDLKDELMVFPDSVNANSVELHWISDPQFFDNTITYDAVIDLLFTNDASRVEWLLRLNCPLTIVNSVEITLKESQNHFVRINGWKSFLKRNSVEASISDEEKKKSVEKLFQGVGRSVEWVPDIKGMLSPRIVSSIINEAYYSLDEKISTEEEIDTAMKLGTNYPYGPFEWGKIIGLRKVYALLELLSAEDPRYAPSPLLKLKALA